MDMTKLRVAFRNFANAPKVQNVLGALCGIVGRGKGKALIRIRAKGFKTDTHPRKTLHLQGGVLHGTIFCYQQ